MKDYVDRFDMADIGLDPETQSETTPRDSEGKPQVGFVEAKRMPPEVLEWLKAVKEGRVAK